MSRRALPIYEATVTLPNGVDLAVQGRPGRCPLEADGWTLLAVDTDEAHPVRYALDNDGGDAEETLVRAALVERWTDAQRDIPPDDTAACVAEMRADDEEAIAGVVALFEALRDAIGPKREVQP